MDKKIFNHFKDQLKEAMPKLIEEILSYQIEEKVYGISFMTTDDFYGMYVAFETEEHLLILNQKYEGFDNRWCPNEWGYSDQDLPSNYNDVLYENMVAVIESDEDVDFTYPSDEKWAVALIIIEAVGEALNHIPAVLFEKYGYQKDEIAFLITMSDGDYMEEMLRESAKAFNSAKTSEKILLNRH